MSILVKFICFLRKRKKAFEKKDNINQEGRGKNKIQTHHKPTRTVQCTKSQIDAKYPKWRFQSEKLMHSCYFYHSNNNYRFIIFIFYNMLIYTFSC